MKKIIIITAIALTAVACSSREGNIAKYCKAFHSSSLDYNLTAQLVTDGRITTQEPAYMFEKVDTGVLEKRLGEYLTGSKTYSIFHKEGNSLALEIELNNCSVEADSMILAGQMTGSGKFSLKALGTTDSSEWKEICHLNAPSLPEIKSNGQFILKLPLDQARTYTGLRIEMEASQARAWDIFRWNFFKGGKRLNVSAMEFFTSCWMSAGCKDEWVYVDLGESKVSYSRILLDWVRNPSKAVLQLSDDAVAWKDAAELSGDMSSVDLSGKHHERFVRVYVPESDGRVALSELRVIGTRKSADVKRPEPYVKDGRMYITGGNWELRRSDSNDETDWIPARVPGTVLSSFLDYGAIPDPNYSDNQLQISESYFNHDFDYRTSFKVPENYDKERVILNFDGINWKAEVSLNGKFLGKIEGAFKKTAFDVTDIIEDGEVNSLDVHIHRLDNPGPTTEQNMILADGNGGPPGYDSPTFLASIGWDWIPTIRGRNIGIWDDVYLTTTDDLLLSDVFVQPSLNLPDTTKAKVTISAVIENTDDDEEEAVVKGSFGEWEFSGKVTVPPSGKVNFEKVLDIDNPRLWWPNGYGKPELYDVKLAVFEGKEMSDSVSFKSGIRQMSYDTAGGILNIFVNGRRFIARGGSWGFSESNLRYGAEDYETALAYHEDMNFTMIRNWVAQTEDKEFFEACDRHGIMIWEDFCLANPVDGPDPENEGMFMDNSIDFIKKLRNHPCIALYCGRNEGLPPASLDKALASAVSELHPGLFYMPHSSEGLVWGYGPYRPSLPSYYFSLARSEYNHSERGYANVMNFESLQLTLPEDKLWPINSQWGMHDFTMRGHQRCEEFIGLVDKAFGESSGAKEFTERAQWINYNGYRAIFEGRSDHRMGILLWMSHPAWPSMVWQTYDYYRDPTAAYFGCKKACAPVHIQWNPVLNRVEVVNLSAGNLESLTADTEIYDMNGKLLFSTTAQITSPEDSTVPCAELDYPDCDVCYIVLTLKDKDNVIADNFYVKGREEGNYKALNSLPQADVKMTTDIRSDGGDWVLDCRLENSGSTPALMLRLMAQAGGSRVLPVFYQDNYFSLLPGKEKTVTVRVAMKDCHGEKPEIRLTGFNYGKN